MVHREAGRSKLDLLGESLGLEFSTGPGDDGYQAVDEVGRFELQLNQNSFWMAVPAWFVSTLIHVAVLLFMATFHFQEITLLTDAYVIKAMPVDTVEDIEKFALEESMKIDVLQASEQSTPQTLPMIQEVSDTPTNVAFDNMAPALPSLNLSGLASDLLGDSSLSTNVTTRQGLHGRSKEIKRDLLERYGGNADTEKAVATALKWLSQHQLADGSWTFAHGLACGAKCKDNGRAGDARNAATGLALMSFLGAGQTHLEGDYKPTVFKGLAFLLRNMQAKEGKMPSWYVNGKASESGAMYSHGIASIAICEAYGMTKDSDLRLAAQAAINFIAYAQSPETGGWDYSPKKSGGGDTSVVGWQLMALKSAAMGNLDVPLPVLKKAQKYLDSVASRQGAVFGYRRRDDGKEGSAMSACGLLCKMYMGLPKDDPGLQAGVKSFVKRGPVIEDIYFSYYATQVLKQVGGPFWDEWNAKMKAVLLTSQVKEGHAAGSWFDESVAHGDVGGRLYTTCMSVMMLEVYYRYMPIYSEHTLDEAFKL